MPPQGLITFPLIPNIQSATFVLTPGITPSVCTVRLPANLPVRAGVGRLQFTFGNVRFAFNHCAVKQSSARFDRQGSDIVLQIVDRRWRWRFGEINGRYNLRTADNAIIESTRKSVRQLASLCLAGLNEPRASTAALPDDVFPRTHWRHIPPARALNELCRDSGCRVVLGVDDRVRIVRAGERVESPANGAEIFAGEGVTSRLRPASVKVAGGETLCQTRLPLQAVGLDFDGSIRPINDLSYTPSHGWSQEYAACFANLGSPDSPLESAASRGNRALAEQSVFRWYAVAGDAAGRITLPEFGSLESVDQILPLRSHRLEFGEDQNGKRRELPATVQGVYHAGGEDLGNTPPYTLYTDEFTIDEAAGIVKFFHPVFKLSSAGLTLPAELTLTTSFPVRSSITHEYHHEVHEERLSGGSDNVDSLVISRDDLRRRIIRKYHVSGDITIDDNLPAFQRAARAHAKLARREFEQSASREIRYAGLVPVQADGVFEKITWSVDKDHGAETIVTN